mgnify:CR=1 FL=1
MSSDHTPDHEYTADPVCPHCGAVQRDAWEIDFGGCEGTTEIDCGECEKPMEVSRHCSVTYTTAKKKGAT